MNVFGEEDDAPVVTEEVKEKTEKQILNDLLWKTLLPSILRTHKDVFKDDVKSEKVYVPYAINRALSWHFDCVIQANEMNRRPNIDKYAHYSYLLNTIRPWKRPFLERDKKSVSADEDLECVKEFFSFSTAKAKAALRVLSEDQLDEIKRVVEKGGASRNVNIPKHDRGDS
jgi:hypothetical protein